MANADRSAEQFRKMTETPIPKLILSLAAPTILSMLITIIYNLADTFFVGQISTSASGAVGIVSSLMAILQALGFMLGHGSGSIISRSLGSQNTDAATRFASTSFFTALVFGGIITAAGLLTLPDFMMLLGSTETILPHACAYPLFIFGLGMGTAGAGLATALSQTISFCILLSMFLRGKTVSQFRITAVTHSPAEFGTILMTGMPSFGRQGLNSIGGMLLNIAARGYGDAAVAGMSIVSRIFMFIISVAIGTGQGFQPVAGFNYGAQKYRRVQQACLFTMAASFCFLSVILTACWFNAETLIRLFRDDPEVTAVALPAFRYQCFAMLLQPVIVAGNMLFQSIGKSGRATFLACCRQGVFFIPLILTLPRAFGLLGVEICQPIADVLTFFVTVPFLFPFLRQLVRMDEAEAAEV